MEGAGEGGTKREEEEVSEGEKEGGRREKRQKRG